MFSIELWTAFWNIRTIYLNTVLKRTVTIYELILQENLLQEGTPYFVNGKEHHMRKLRSFKWWKGCPAWREIFYTETAAPTGLVLHITTVWKRVRNFEIKFSILSSKCSRSGELDIGVNTESPDSEIPYRFISKFNSAFEHRYIIAVISVHSSLQSVVL